MGQEIGFGFESLTTHLEIWRLPKVRMYKEYQSKRPKS